jgi:hypothetical protein
MRRLRNWFFLAVLGLSLLACQFLTSQISPAPTPTVPTPPRPSQTSVPVALPSSTPALLSTPTENVPQTPTNNPPTEIVEPTSAEPTSASLEPTHAATASGPTLTVWKGIPIMPGATEGGEEAGSYNFKVKASVQEVENYYKQQLEKLGYQNFAFSSGDANSSIMIYQKGTEMLTFAIVKDPVSGLTLVILSQS